MSLYKNLRPVLHTHRVDACWSRSLQSYCIWVNDQQPKDPSSIWSKARPVVFEAGTCADSRLATLYDLLSASWHFVRWDYEIHTLQKLAIDPMIDSYSHNACESVGCANEDPRDEIRNLLELVYGQSQYVDLPAAATPLSQMRTGTAEVG